MAAPLVLGSRCTGHTGHYVPCGPCSWDGWALAAPSSAPWKETADLSPPVKHQTRFLKTDRASFVPEGSFAVYITCCCGEISQWIRPGGGFLLLMPSKLSRIGSSGPTVRKYLGQTDAKFFAHRHTHVSLKCLITSLGKLSSGRLPSPDPLRVLIVAGCISSLQANGISILGAFPEPKS